MKNIEHGYNIYTHKQGDSFNYCGPISLDQDDLINSEMTTNFSGWSGSSRIKLDDGTEVAILEFTWISAENGILRIKDIVGTDSWPIGRVLMDIELITPDGDKVSSATIVILIEKDIT